MSAFASVFSAAFVGRNAYIAPMAAQSLLLAGLPAGAVAGGGVVVNGRRLIGPRGKAYRFASPESAARWIERTRAAAVGEAATLAGLSPVVLASWRERKHARAVSYADRLAEAAARQADAGKRAALIEEAGAALAKWGAP